MWWLGTYEMDYEYVIFNLLLATTPLDLFTQQYSNCRLGLYTALNTTAHLPWTWTASFPFLYSLGQLG